MNGGSMQILLDEPSAHYEPGQQLTGRYLVDGSRPAAAKAAELSVLWYTAGKGDEDMYVHYFERKVDDATRALDPGVPHRFTTILPASPLSYDGHIVKVCWCVRLRLFFPDGREAVAEVPFRLGSVPGAQWHDERVNPVVSD